MLRRKGGGHSGRSNCQTRPREHECRAPFPCASTTGTGRACALVAALVGIVIGSVGCADAPDPTVAALDRVRAAAYPSTYTFTFRPFAQPLAGCIGVPQPNLVGSVDLDRETLTLRDASDATKQATTIDGTSYLHRSWLSADAGEQTWAIISANEADPVVDDLREVVGPAVVSFVAPPHMPNDPNTTLLAAVDASSSVQVIDDDAKLVHITATTAPQTVAETATDSGSRRDPAEAEAELVIDAWIDPAGLVVRMTVTQPNAAIPDGDHRVGYEMTFEPDAVPTVSAPDPSQIHPVAGLLRSSKQPECTISVGR